MNRSEIESIVIDTISEFVRSVGKDMEINAETPVYADESPLDSMDLVNIVVDIEGAFRERDLEISLASDKAMSRRNSPFQSVSTLTDFIYEQLG